MKRILTRIFSFVVISGLFISGLNFFGYLVTDDTSSYTRIMMHQMYESDCNIDVLFVGSSHVYRSLIPEIADDIFGTYTFNAGTSSQSMDGSYALIKEALENYDVSQVYLELYYGMACNGLYKDRTQLTGTYIIADYIKNPINKMLYLLRASSKEYYANSFIIARRNWEDLLNPNKVINLVNKKNTSAYKSYEYVKNDNAVEYYVDRGFVANDFIPKEEMIWSTTGYGEIRLDGISDDYLNSLDDISVLCKENNVELILFIAPMPEVAIVGKRNYNDYSVLMENKALEMNCKFYDFNLCNAKYFDSNDYKLFKDEDHLNTAGAKKFTKIFSSFFAGEIDEKELFYESLDEKLSCENPRVYGIAKHQDAENEPISAYMISNRMNGIKYRIVTRSSENGEETLVQDFSVNSEFSLPYNEHGELIIDCKINDEIMKTINTTY